MLIQEERLKKMIIDHSEHLTLNERASSSKNNKKEKAPINVKDGKIHKGLKCFFRKKNCHLRNDCLKQKVWFKKKATYFISIRDSNHDFIVVN